MGKMSCEKKNIDEIKFKKIDKWKGRGEKLNRK